MNQVDETAAAAELEDPNQANPTCRTCIYWGNIETGGDHRYGHAGDESRANRRICGCPKIKHEPDSYHATDWPDDEVEICDGSDYWGAMFPGPGYWCHHHKPKGKVTA